MAGRQGLPLVIMDLELEASLPLPGVPCWAEEESSQGGGRLIRPGEIEADCAEADIVLREPEPEVPAFQDLDTLNSKAFATENRRRVSLAERCHELQMGHECRCDLAQMGFGVGFPRRERTSVHRGKDFFQGSSERGKLIDFEAEASGEFVTAEAAEMSPAGAQGPVKIDTAWTPA
jgi:hypothetical protein